MIKRPIKTSTKYTKYTLVNQTKLFHKFHELQPQGAGELKILPHKNINYLFYS